MWRVNFPPFAQLWKLQNFTATIFPQKFRQINVLLKKFTINWFDGKNFAYGEILVFPHCVFANFTKIPWNYRTLVVGMYADFTKYFSNERKCTLFVGVIQSQFGNCCDLVSHIFGKNFVKLMFLLKILVKSWFDEKFLWWDQIFHFSTLCQCYNIGVTNRSSKYMATCVCMPVFNLPIRFLQLFRTIHQERVTEQLESEQFHTWQIST